MFFGKLNAICCFLVFYRQYISAHGKKKNEKYNKREKKTISNNNNQCMNVDEEKKCAVCFFLFIACSLNESHSSVFFSEHGIVHNSRRRRRSCSFDVYLNFCSRFISGDERPHLHVCEQQAIAIVTSVFAIFVYVRTTDIYLSLLFAKRMCMCVLSAGLHMCVCFFLFFRFHLRRSKNAFRDLSKVINLPCAICMEVCMHSGFSVEI